MRLMMAAAAVMMLVGCGKTNSQRCDDICDKSDTCDTTNTVDVAACRASCKDSLSGASAACTDSLATLDDCYTGTACSDIGNNCLADYYRAGSDCQWPGQPCDDICNKTYQCDNSTDLAGCLSACEGSVAGASSTCAIALGNADFCYATTACIDLAADCTDDYNSAASACGW